jgi:energy-coupling factor transporter ATP-binding protein EcfA2
MILHGIKAHNFMSLRDCTIDKLDGHLNFLVGPNGSGKTTVFRALKVIRDIFNPGKTVPFNQFCTRGVAPQEVELTIDVEFDTEWEQELITTFLCASLSRPEELRSALSRIPYIRSERSLLGEEQPQKGSQVSSEGLAAFSQWFIEHLRPETVPFLFRGKIHVLYLRQIYESLYISYTFDCGSSPLTITVKPIDSVLLSGAMPENFSGGYSFAVNTLLDFFQETKELENVVSLLTEQRVTAINAFDPVACLLYLAKKRVEFRINGMDPQLASLPAYRSFAELSGNLNLANQSNRSFTFGYVLQLLLQHAFVFTNNLRIPISESITFNRAEAENPNLDLDDERQIPLLLFRLKNGDFVERARFQRIQESFRSLVGEDLSFDISAILGNDQQSALSIDIQVTDPEGEISITYHGAGIWEALILSTILDESEGRVVLLDEPASNLHPGMQHRLVEVLRSVPGQVIVVTHSANMLPTAAEDFLKVRRMQKTSTGALIKGMNSSSWLKLDKLEKELNKSSDLAGLLFAYGVILVEGETETGALSEWYPKSSVGQGKAFADLNLALSWVGGKTNFPFYMHFLSEFGVPWVAICDGDALPIDKDRNYLLWNTFRDLKRIDHIPDATASFEELKALAEKAGVYTANTSPAGKFEDIPDIKNYKCSNAVYGGGKVQQGRYIAAHIPCPEEVDEILRLVLQ